MTSPRPFTLFRWVAAVASAGYGVFLLARVLETETNWILVFAKSLFGIALLISGVLWIAPECVGWAVAPVHRLLDRIFLPSESDPPPLDYTLARLYDRRGRYGEACEEYAKIVRYHPRETEAYLSGIEAARRGQDPEQALRFYRAARRMMRSKEQRALLESVFSLPPRLPKSAGD